MISYLIYITIGFVIVLIMMRLSFYLHPKETLSIGKKVEIYLDSIHNRTATISHNYNKSLVIYGVLKLPVDYRGRFYAIGYTDDGHTLMFIGRKRLYFLAHMAELIRKIVGTPEYQDPTIENEMDVVKDEKAGEETENEQ